MMTPIILLFKDKKKTWCQNYCPRSHLFTKVGKVTGKHSRKTPMYFIKGNFKWIMLTYFMINFTVILVTTLLVAFGKAPSTSVKFLMFFKLPFTMPQLLKFSSLPSWGVNFAFSMYSMMLTTTIIGLGMALIYRPRTWCTICPISTISEVYLNSVRKKRRVENEYKSIKQN